jgi:hypothetical protein
MVPYALSRCPNLRAAAILLLNSDVGGRFGIGDEYPGYVALADRNECFLDEKWCMVYGKESTDVSHMRCIHT